MEMSYWSVYYLYTDGISASYALFPQTRELSELCIADKWWSRSLATSSHLFLYCISIPHHSLPPLSCASLDIHSLVSSELMQLLKPGENHQFYFCCVRFSKWMQITGGSDKCQSGHGKWQTCTAGKARRQGRVVPPPPVAVSHWISSSHPAGLHLSVIWPHTEQMYWWEIVQGTLSNFPAKNLAQKTPHNSSFLYQNLSSRQENPKLSNKIGSTTVKIQTWTTDFLCCLSSKRIHSSAFLRTHRNTENQGWLCTPSCVSQHLYPSPHLKSSDSREVCCQKDHNIRRWFIMPIDSALPSLTWVL